MGSFGQLKLGFFNNQIKLNYILYRYFHLYHKMDPFEQLSLIGRAQNFVINRNNLSKDNYSYINLAHKERHVFQRTNITQLYKISIFLFISQNGPSRTVIRYLQGSKFCYQQKSFIR